MQSEVGEAVDRFLAPMSARHRLARICRRMAQAGEHEGPSRRALGATVAWITGPLVDPRLLALHRRVSGPRSIGDAPTPAERELLLSAAYLRVSEHLRTPTGALQDQLADTGQAMVVGWDALQRVEPGFAGELLVETGLRRARDPQLARRLRAARDALAWLHPRVGELARRVHELSPDPEPTRGSNGDRVRARRQEFDASKVAVAAALALVGGIAVGVAKEGS